jgi:DNA (cytosine-5)-methyltransferase 1
MIAFALGDGRVATFLDIRLAFTDCVAIRSRETAVVLVHAPGDSRRDTPPRFSRIRSPPLRCARNRYRHNFNSSRLQRQNGRVAPNLRLYPRARVANQISIKRREQQMLMDKAPSTLAPVEEPRSTARQVWSFFTGAMGLDLGLEAADLTPTLANEIDRNCCATIRRNRPTLQLLEDSIATLTANELHKRSKFDGDIFLMVGGPPCQSFCSGGKRAALSDPRGNLIYEYLRLVSEVRPRYFVLENVANLTTAAIQHRPISQRPGQRWSLKSYSEDNTDFEDELRALTPDELSSSAVKRVLEDVDRLGYHIVFGVLDAADYGAPQHRLRFVLIGSRSGPSPSLPPPSHGLHSATGVKYRTVWDAIAHLQQAPGDHSEYTARVRQYFELVPPGGNWRSLPIALQKEALGGSFEAGGGKTGFYRRLSWETPAPTITGRANRKGSALCHPADARPLSVLECAALQGFPPTWEFVGSMNARYMQIGNAVPLYLGTAIGTAILTHNGLKEAPKQDANFDAMLDAALHRLRSAAKNKRSAPATLNASVA